MQELFETRNGRVIMDEDLSSKMYLIKQYHPEKADETSSGFEWSEMGMANLFGLLYSHEARYCPEHKSWYTYHEGAWRKDEGAILVSEKIKDFVRLMILYCGEIEDDDTRKSYTGFVNKMGDRRMRDRILKDATGELRISAVQFDADPYLINCLNGTYDLRDFSFREHSWDDFLTMQTAFSHTISKTVKCKRWEKFIKEVTQNDEDKADFLQRALGYSMLGMSNEECMFILHGKTTRNGKSTLLNTIETMLGDYAKVAPVGMICRGDRQKDAEAASPTLAGLKGKRFVTMSESNEYGKLDEEKIKQLTKTKPSTFSRRTSRTTTTIPLMKSENATLQATSRSDFRQATLTRTRATKRLSPTLRLSDYQPSDFRLSTFDYETAPGFPGAFSMQKFTEIFRKSAGHSTHLFPTLTQ